MRKKKKVENKEQRDRNVQGQPCSQASEIHTEGKIGKKKPEEKCR